MRQDLEAIILKFQGESWKDSHPQEKTIPESVIATFSQVAQTTSSTLLTYDALAGAMPLAGVMPTGGVTPPLNIPVAEGPVTDFIHTDVRKFYQIAQESIAFVRKDLAERIRPTPGGGFSSKVDPESRGMKASFTAIVFSGVFLDAVLHLLLVSRKGVSVARKLDREIYEVKLRALGCEDARILALCKEYRDSRNEIVHEKAYFEDSHRLPPIAQVEAEAAISLIEKVIDFFGIREKLALNPAK